MSSSSSPGSQSPATPRSIVFPTHPDTPVPGRRPGSKSAASNNSRMSRSADEARQTLVPAAEPQRRYGLRRRATGALTIRGESGCFQRTVLSDSEGFVNYSVEL
jgi:hypothetical protein